MTDGMESPATRLSKAKQALSIVVQRFEESEKNLEPLNDFGNCFANIEASSVGATDQQVAEYAVRLRGVAKNIVFMQRILGAKVRWISSGALTSLDTENLLVMAYCTRALFEHCAAYIWLNEKVEEFAKSLENKSNERLIESAFSRVEGLLHSVYYNKDGDKGFIHISAMLKSMARNVSQQKEIYGRLCDYLHPNYGSNLLVSSGDIGSGIINPNVLWRIDEVVFLTATAMNCIEEVTDTCERLHLKIFGFLGLVTLAGKPGVTLARWFSVRTAKHQGDGKSKETAIWFPSARTKVESMKMLGEFLSASGLEPIGQSFAGIDDGWAYDNIETSGALLWFRSPATL